ncbi:MFS transporter [Cytobacillus sp. Hz8]|uniref:MFS transporter n=1 Tax=Cytobacillus sp. Hz8 TaxID=3347168 RepID=UPI0035DF5CC6
MLPESIVGVAKTRKRYGIAVSLFILYLIAYVDRANITILLADKPFTDALGITGDFTAQGLLMTFFLLTYGLANFITGAMSDKLGSRVILTIVCICWAVDMILMGFTSAFILMLIFRAVLGFAESPLTPTTDRLVMRWFPSSERNFANAIWLVGLTLAPVITLPLVAKITAVLGWRANFFIFGLIGLIIPIILIYRYVYDRPSDHPSISKWELEHIGDGLEVKKDAKADNKPSIWKRYDYWFLIASYSLAIGFGWGLMSWFPSYLTKELNISFINSSFLSALPWVASIVIVLIVSPLADRLKTRNWLLIVALTVSATLMYVATLFQNVTLIVTIMSIATGVVQICVFVSHFALQSMANSWNIATAGGVMNGTGYVWSALVPLAVGAIIDATGTFTSGFIFLIGTGLLGAILAIPVYVQELNGNKQVISEEPNQMI